MCEQLTMDLVFRQYQDKVSRYVRFRIANYHDAQDAVSDVFVRVSAALDRYDSTRGSLSSWVYAITRNTVRDYFRALKPGVCLDDQADLSDGGGAVEDAVLSRELLAELANALQQLSQRERDVLILRFWQGLSPGEIAEKMKISYSNAGFIQSNALKKLRTLLQCDKGGAGMKKGLLSLALMVALSVPPPGLTQGALLPSPVRKGFREEAHQPGGIGAWLLERVVSAEDKLPDPVKLNPV